MLGEVRTVVSLDRQWLGEMRGVAGCRVAPKRHTHIPELVNVNFFGGRRGVFADVIK